MAGQFGRMVARLHAVAFDQLADGLGTYTEQGQAPVSGLSLIVEHNLQREGPEGLFMTDQVGITWRPTQLATAKRGALFEIDGRRYRVDDLIADDGQAITAACTVTT